jgi:enoyl-CoA hydratase/carnithine racemase
MTGTIHQHDEVAGKDAFGHDVVVRVLTLDDAARRNALTRPMLSTLSSLLPERPAGRGQPVRAVVVEGAGATFSSGFDLDALDDDERARGVDPITPAADALQRCPVPVVAAVDGACMGGAVELVCACAIRVATTTTTFAVPAARLGLVYPTGGLVRFRAVLGRNAERVLVVGRPFSADDARAWGLIHDVVDDARAHARALAASIAQNAPLAVSGTLAALAAVDAHDLAAVHEARRAALDSDDLREGIAAAQRKRPPVFGGR